MTAANPIVCENALPGDPMSDWYAASAYGDIQGFTDQISYQIGNTVNFKVQSPVSYTITILRLGWYGGDGARIMDGSPTQTFPAKTQPACVHASEHRQTSTVATGRPTYSWTVPSDAVSGVYIANLEPERQPRLHDRPVRGQEQCQPLRDRRADRRRDVGGLQHVDRDRPLPGQRARSGRPGVRGQLQPADEHRPATTASSAPSTR